MWLGFFAWYHGLTLGGVVRVSQVQLLQPFLALLFAVPLLGERLDARDARFRAGGGRGGAAEPAHAGGVGRPAFAVRPRRESGIGTVNAWPENPATKGRP